MKAKPNNATNPERIRQWKLQKAAHKLKNRSSKHLAWLKALKPIVRSLSGAQLQELAKNDCFDASMEIQRRANKAAKKAAKTA